VRSDAQRNHARVLEAAHEVFAERGLKVSVDEVARAAGVGVGTLYRRFETRERLLAAVIEERLDSLVDELEAGLPGATAWERFAAAAGALAERTAVDRCLVETLQATEELQPLAEEARRRVRAAIAPLVADAQRAGDLRGDVSADDVLALTAIAARLPEARLREEPDVWRRYLSVVLDGLRAP
jgi:AcrR family transcriptional regulator